MFKKLLSVLLSFVLIFSLAACGGGEKEGTTSSPSSTASSVVQEDTYNLNPLTGIADLDESKLNLRPVAIMIDNDSAAQKNAQSGVSQADIVYETEVEGGITRLMAVFKDISKVTQVGDVRSARYVYVDLAMGHNAIYVHSGRDYTYCAPHLNDLDNFEITTGNYAWRQTYGGVKNWQNLFTSGEKLNQGFKDKKWTTNEDSVSPWQTFAAEDETVTLTGGTANKITAKFSNSYISYFTYDSASGKYIKTSKQATNQDRNNGAKYAVKNVLVLQTSISNYPDNYHRKVDLSSGSGYYATNGTYEKINWKKGGASDPIVLTRQDGTTLTLSAGNTWVCIINQNNTVGIE